MADVPETRHPLLVGGDKQAGRAFSAILHHVLPEAKYRNNRGFTESVLAEIETGRRPVSLEAVQQLTTDYFVAFPKLAARGSAEYLWLKSIINGASPTPNEQPARPKAPEEMVQALKMRALVSEHGQRIVLLCDACGVYLVQARRAMLLGETREVNIPNDVLSSLADQLQLPQAVLLGKRNFDRQLSLVSRGALWQGPPGPFVPGDRRKAYMWASLVSNYTGIKRWFRKEYGLSDEHIDRIASSELGVPIPVHLVLMHTVAERLASIDNPVVPLAYLRLQELENQLPQRLLSLSTATPCKDWFQRLAQRQ